MYVTVGLYVYIYCIEIVAINQLLPISSHFGKKKNTWWRALNVEHRCSAAEGPWSQGPQGRNRGVLLK